MHALRMARKRADWLWRRCDPRVICYPIAMTRNLITDVTGVRVGHAGDAKLGSGSTVIVFDQPAVAAADLGGGGPGTRESALLDPAMTVQTIDAIAISGGSAFGLDAASGLAAWLVEQ